MIKHRARAITAAIVRGERSRCARRAAPVPAVLLRASLAIAVSAALAVTASAAPAQATVSGLGGQVAGRAVPPTAPGSEWSITPTPNPRAGNGVLNAVSCPATSVCTAVGLHVRESGLRVTLAERRSGSVWAVQPTSNPPGAVASAFNGVSCPARSACTAVGQFVVKSGVQLTLAERWNGSNWAIQPTPNPAGSSSSTLFAVACQAAGACTAVGTANSKLLVERFGGARWRIQPAPVPHGAQSSELLGVTCAAATSCVAVGDYVNSSGGDVTLAERWNGAGWAIQPTPNPSGAQSFTFLSGVSCTAGDACEASGASDAGAFAERWNGTRWSLQAVPAPAGAQFALLFSVSCALSACEAAGGYADSSGAFVPLGERWNGAAWRARSAPNPARASTNYLKGVSCPSPSDCTAVGQGNTDGTPFTLGERSRDGRWSIEAMPSPVGAAQNQLTGIACPATGRCEAVGTAGPTRGVVSAEALRWNGTRWSNQPIPSAPGASLSALSCVSPSACVAVGGSDSGVFAERWNGTRWRILPAPAPKGATFSGLGSVSCLSPSFCMAAGAYVSSSPDAPVNSLTERWNGKKWAIAPSPNPAGAAQTFFNGVSCTSPSACTATGEQHSASGIVHTVAERWDGATWTIQPTPNPAKVQFASLGGVACTGPSACLAVGGSDQGTLAERWDGTMWHIQPIPTPPGGGPLNGLACPAPAACTAVGFTFTSSGGMILAERWNGTAWRIQPTPLLPASFDISLPAVACPARTTCTAVGGFKNDGPGMVSLAERWQGNGTSAAETAPAAFSPRAHRGIADCVGAALGEGFATGAAAPRIGPMFKALLPQRSQPAPEIERVCGTLS